MLQPRILLLVALFPAALSAQIPDLGPLNDAFRGRVTFKIDRQHRLVADFFDEGSRFRQDIAPLVELDTNAVSYSSEEDALVLKCLAEKGQCFTKEIFKLDVVRLTARSTLPRPADDPGGERSMELLRDLIRVQQAQLALQYGETREYGTRKNAR